jgi:hypothetical protein
MTPEGRKSEARGTSIARQGLGKNVSAETDTHAIEEFLGTMFSVRSV